MHIRAHIQPSRLLAGSVVEDLLQLLTAVVGPTATYEHVRFSAAIGG